VSTQPTTVEQIDIAVDLGVVPRPLPEILNLRQLVETAPAAPPEIIECVLHQGCKMAPGVTSKSNSRGVCFTCGRGQPGKISSRIGSVGVVFLNVNEHPDSKADAWLVAGC